MPSVSKAQKKFFAAAANNPKFAKEAGISQSTAKEWHEKDKKQGDKKLPDRKAKEKTPTKVSKETYTTTASLSGPKGFKDQ